MLKTRYLNSLLALTTVALVWGCQSSPEFFLGDESGERADGGASGNASGQENIDVDAAGGSGTDTGNGSGGGSAVLIPCAGVNCSVGQRCEDDSCVDNTCAELSCGSLEVCEAAVGGGNVCNDISCESNVDCAPEEYCGLADPGGLGGQTGDAGMCTADVCDQDSLTCDGDTLLSCSSTGADEKAFSCQSDAYFSASCDDTLVASCTCEDDWDCPQNMECEVGLCVGTGEAPTCTLPPVPFTDTPPEIEIHWGGDVRDDDDAHDGNGDPAPWPQYSQVIGTPLVANLDDDNGDGRINELDFPEIIFIAYEGHQAAAPNGTGDWKTDGVVRAIHGGGPGKGKDFFARCGNNLWQEPDPADMNPPAIASCTNSGSGNNGEGDALAGSTPAVADLDYDGIPEIIYVREDDRLRILSNTGELLLTTPVNTWSTNQDAETVSVANLNYDGHAEIIVGRTVIMLEDDAQGDLVVSHILEGAATQGINPFGPMSCVADVHSSPGQEIAAGVSLYRLPDVLPTCGTPPCKGALELVWDATDVPANAAKKPVKREGFCAVANVWGPDFAARPGPNNHPQTPGVENTPEIVLIADGNLIILDAESGEVIHQENLGGGQDGGAPNIDDFDGDGFMEVASALQNFYVVVDLQDPSTSCPFWSSKLTRAVGDNQLPATYNPNLPAAARVPGDTCSSDTDCNDGAYCGTDAQCSCLHNGWRRDSDDGSSRATSSSVFDFNGDGAAEVVYNDECEMRVFDGSTGAVLYNQLSRSRTAIENPVVADVDNDGNAEIVTIMNTEANSRCDLDGANPTAGPNGIRVWGDPTDTWVSARRIWNQQSYHVTNITESGQVPLHPPESWGSFGGRTYNTYRSQPRNFGAAPDLSVSGVGVSSPDAACGTLSEKIEISFQIENLGDLRVGPGVEVSFFGSWSASEEVLINVDGPITFVIEQSLEPGAALIASITFDVGDQPGQVKLPDQVRVEVDTGGEPASLVGAERECVEDNNDRTQIVDAGEQRADLGVSAAAATINCSAAQATLEVTVNNTGSKAASNVLVAVFAGDPSQGGQLLYTETLPGTIEAGANIQKTLSFGFSGAAGGVILWAVVDPNGVVEECNDVNNRDPADNATAPCVIITK